MTWEACNITSTNRMQSILKRSLKLCFRADFSMKIVGDFTEYWYFSVPYVVVVLRQLSLVFWY